MTSKRDKSEYSLIQKEGDSQDQVGIKINNPFAESIYIPVEAIKGHMWYSPESVAYFLQNKGKDTIFFKARLTSCFFSVRMDTLKKSDSRYYVLSKKYLPNQLKGSDFAQLELPYYKTDMTKQKHFLLLVQITGDRNKLKQMDKPIPKKARKGDSIEVGGKKFVLMY